MGYFPKWRLKTDGIIGPDERLPASQMAALGVQHVVAMFGSTILAPLLMGFDPNVAVLMSGIGTLIFFLIVGGRVPSYLGSSFAFIGVVIAATGYAAGSGLNANISIALGGIIACGIMVAYALEAVKQLRAEGFDAGVIDMHTIKPLDTELVLRAAARTGRLVTVEDAFITGGLGGAVCETIAEGGVPCRVKRLGIPDIFPGFGSFDEQMGCFCSSTTMNRAFRAGFPIQ